MARGGSTWRRRLGGFAVRLGLVVVGLAVALLVVEISLRAFGLDRPAELDATFDRPARFYRPQRGRANPWAAGHSDPLRVAVIGDSFTVGQGVHRYDAYPARLEALLNLNEGQRPAVVRVYARRGTSTRGQLGFLRRAVAWPADVLVLGIFINDAERAGDRALKEWRRRLLPRPPQGRLAGLVRRSAALGWIYQRLENLRCSRSAVAYYRHIWDPEYEGFRDLQRSLRTFRDETDAAGIRFLPVIFPGLQTAGEDYASRFVHDRLHAALDAEDLPFLDLLEVFEPTAPLRMSAFPKVDSHPSEIAHRLAADAIFHRLLADGTIDAGYRPKRFEIKTRKAWLQEVRRLRSVADLPPKPRPE